MTKRLIYKLGCIQIIQVHRAQGAVHIEMQRSRYLEIGTCADLDMILIEVVLDALDM